MMMVRVLASALEREGGSRTQFLELAGIEPSLFDDSQARLSLDTYLRVVDAALAVSKDPAFGLHLGEHASPMMFDVIGHLAQNTATLRDSVHTMQRYAKLAADGHDPELIEDENQAAIRFPSLRGNWAAVRLTAEFTLTALLSSLRLFVGPEARPNSVSFAYEQPAYWAEYARVFGAPVSFACEVTEIAFPRAWLDRAHGYPSSDLHALLVNRAEQLLGRLERDAALSERVTQILSTCDPRKLPTMDAVARELQMSARSLRRKLAAEKVSYTELAERALANAAMRMLRESRTSIQETAFAMGFAAPAAFHRAFKRWTGMTPKQYRASF